MSFIRLVILCTWSTVLGSIGGLFLIFYLIKVDAFGWFGGMPSFERYLNPEISHASLLYASDGIVLGKYYRKHRTLVRYEDLSDPLKETLLSTEDRNFFEHSGIDLRGLIRAIIGTLSLNYQGGGSTLTMQLAENLFQTETTNKGSFYDWPLVGHVVTKFKEWIISIELERNFTKEELMAMYLNAIPFGSNAFGIDAAAKTFFGISPLELNYAESAMLVGLINAPTRYSPVLNPDKALKKRNEVLYKTYRHGRLSQEHYLLLSKEPIVLHYEVDSHDRGLATYFRTVARNFLIRWAQNNGYDLFSDGLRIYTTLDSRLQIHAEAAAKEEMKKLQGKFDRHWVGANPWIDEEGKEIKNYLQRAIRRTDIYKELVKTYGNPSQGASFDSATFYNSRVWQELNRKRPMRIFSWNEKHDVLFSYMDSLAYYKRFLHVGMISLEPGSGAIRAWVGGINYKHFKFDHVFQGKRQPGSTFKPFVYTAALDNGYDPCHEVLDQAVTFILPNQYPNTWSPENADGRITGRRMTLRQGMARSVNTITASLLKRIGIRTVVRYAHRIGIQSELSPSPALSLGAGGDVSVFEMAGAYATFANKGIWTEPHFIERIEDKNGNIIEQFVPDRKEALSEETAAKMLYMLKGTLEERGGTAQGIPYDIRHRAELAAKTGTTQNASDGWFIGMRPSLVTCVWVGAEDRSIHFRNWIKGQGARTAMPVWINYTHRLDADKRVPYRGKKFFDRPFHVSDKSLRCKTKKEQLLDADSSAYEAPPVLPESIF